VSWDTAREAPKGLEAVTRLGSTFKLLDPPPEEETRTGKAPETAGDEVFGRTDGAGKAKDALGTAIPFPDETASKPLGGERTRENPEENEPTGRAPGTADDESSGRDDAGKGGPKYLIITIVSTSHYCINNFKMCWQVAVPTYFRTLGG